MGFVEVVSFLFSCISGSSWVAEQHGWFVSGMGWIDGVLDLSEMTLGENTLPEIELRIFFKMR